MRRRQRNRGWRSGVCPSAGSCVRSWQMRGTFHRRAAIHQAWRPTGGRSAPRGRWRRRSSLPQASGRSSPRRTRSTGATRSACPRCRTRRGCRRDRAGRSAADRPACDPSGGCPPLRRPPRSGSPAAGPRGTPRQRRGRQSTVRRRSRGPRGDPPTAGDSPARHLRHWSPRRGRHRRGWSDAAAPRRAWPRRRSAPWPPQACRRPPPADTSPPLPRAPRVRTHPSAGAGPQSPRTSLRSTWRHAAPASPRSPTPIRHPTACSPIGQPVSPGSCP